MPKLYESHIPIQLIVNVTVLEQGQEFPDSWAPVGTEIKAHTDLQK